MTFETERWTYAGRRITNDNKIAHAWIDPHGREVLYDKVRGIGIGGTYLVNVDRSDADRLMVRGTPEFTERGEAAPLDHVAAWQAHDEAARRADGLRKAENRLARDRDALDAAAEPLLRLIRNQRTRTDRRAIVNAMHDRMTEAMWS